MAKSLLGFGMMRLPVKNGKPPIETILHREVSCRD